MLRLLLGTLLVLPCAAPATQAQLRIGQTAGHSGAVAASVKEATDGARLVFDAVNARGGIGGQQLELLVLDDGFDPQRAADNAKALIDRGVITLFLTRGTPHNQRILPLLTTDKLPLVGPSTGAMLLHAPVQPWVFNVRATYPREAERCIQHLLGIGTSRIASVQVDDSVGQDAAVGALRGFGNRSTPLLHDTHDRSAPKFGAIVQRIVAADAQAVLFIESGTAVVEGMQALRAAGSTAQRLTLSNNDWPVAPDPITVPHSSQHRPCCLQTAGDRLEAALVERDKAPAR